MAEVARTGTMWAGLSKATAKSGAVERSWGSTIAQIEKIKAELKKKEDERKKRLLLLKSLMPFASAMDANRARTEAFKQGAEALGIALPKEDLGTKLMGKLGISGPDAGKAYGDIGITGEGLVAVGKTLREAPWMRENIGGLAKQYSTAPELPKQEFDTGTEELWPE